MSSLHTQLLYELVAEGNANAIYRRSDGVCIRVSKNGTDPEIVAAYWNSFWRPKLGEFMGEMDVIEDEKFGKVLKIVEIGRSVVCNSNTHIKIAEFKPKWLHQSPNAPENSTSCRTCAIKTMRKQALSWCSLDLAAKDRLLLLAQNVAINKDYYDLVAKTISESPLIEKLRDWQLKLSTPEHLRDCMSLRDCTVIIEYMPSTKSTRLWLVDLDPKLADAKLNKWRQIECELQPYYIQKSSVCRLSRGL